ncbi:peptidoglycan-recognition protein LB-like [Hyposmocoma kahamanoa]|uniref:peptidoglycan-recognition protein LB-like n=1 Tax=Hyposmocoma kahamanoa TaxID=1477025 RepID=UPI000E6D8CDF|nr:peptidoglycan-recognition protein LB-like [Hyposmocoma kahamanoa]
MDTIIISLSQSICRPLPLCATSPSSLLVASLCCQQPFADRRKVKSFCVGSEGGAYEGRGWEVIGIHAPQANNVSIGICLIGDWRYELPPQIQLETTKALIATGLKRGIISPHYKLIGHSQATTTECPGTALLDHIATWPHYVPGKIDF